VLVGPTTDPLRDKATTFVVSGAHCQRQALDLGRSFGQSRASSRFRTGFDESESLDPAKNLSKQLAGDGDSLPFFAYGLFRPGELAFPLIGGRVVGKTEGRIENTTTVRDGLLLLSKDESGITEGFVLTFGSESQQLAYEEIAKFEPWSQYMWGTTDAVTDRETVAVNVLFGKSPKSGSNDSFDMERSWSGRRDPLFFEAPEVVQELLDNAGEYTAYDVKPTLRLHAAYMLLFSAIERFVSHRYSLSSKEIGSKLKRLAASPEYVKAFRAVVGKTRDVRNPRHKKVTLDPASPEKSMNYYYQVRSTAVHTGKVGFKDYIVLLESTKELLEIFRRVRDEVFPKIEDED